MNAHQIRIQALVGLGLALLPVHIAIQNGLITAIQETPGPPRRSRLVFFDAHTHLARDLPLDNWVSGQHGDTPMARPRAHVARGFRRLPIRAAITDTTSSGTYGCADFLGRPAGALCISEAVALIFYLSVREKAVNPTQKVLGSQAAPVSWWNSRSVLHGVPVKYCVSRKRRAGIKVMLMPRFFFPNRIPTPHHDKKKY